MDFANAIPLRWDPAAGISKTDIPVTSLWSRILPDFSIRPGGLVFNLAGGQPGLYVREIIGVSEEQAGLP